MLPFVLSVFGLAVLHFIVSYFAAFGAGITSERGYKIAAEILCFPLLRMKEPKNLPPILGWLAWVLLSLTWGLALRLLWRLLTGA